MLIPPTCNFQQHAKKTGNQLQYELALCVYVLNTWTLGTLSPPLLQFFYPPAISNAIADNSNALDFFAVLTSSDLKWKIETSVCPPCPLPSANLHKTMPFLAIFCIVSCNSQCEVVECDQNWRLSSGGNCHLLVFACGYISDILSFSMWTQFPGVWRPSCRGKGGRQLCGKISLKILISH